MKYSILLASFTPVLTLLIPGGITTQDTSIPGTLPIWSFVLTTVSCQNATFPKVVLVQLASETTGVYLYPPIWQEINTQMIQDPQVTSISQLQMLQLTPVLAEDDWEICGLQISVNDAQIYADSNQVMIGKNSSYALDLATLQQNALWTQSNQVCNPPAQFTVSDIQELVIGKIGNYIASNNNSIDWQQTNGIGSVNVSLNETTQVATLLQFTSTNGTIPFTLYFNIIVSCGSNQITILITNLYEDYGSNQVTEEQENTISRLTAALASMTSLSASFCPTINVNPDGSVNFAWPFGVGNLGALCWSN